MEQRRSAPDRAPGSSRVLPAEPVFQEVEDLFFTCEQPGHLDRAEQLLRDLAAGAPAGAERARAFGELAQAAYWRYEYAPASQRLALAEQGVALAKRGLDLDPGNLQANAWAAALMGLHGLEMGILSALFYLRLVKRHAGRALALDEGYHSALPHQTLGDLYRLSPPPPVGVRDRGRALQHLMRARELAPACPQAKLRLGELYIALRQKDAAREQLRLVLDQQIVERGPLFAQKQKARATELLRRLG